MPESIASVASYFGAEGAAASGTAAAAGGAAETAGVVGATAASGAGAGYAGGSTLLGSVGQAAATAAGTALGAGVVGAALAPKRPDLPKATPMPDAQAQEEARKRQIIEATARRGRASTILTDAASGTLGG